MTARGPWGSVLLMRAKSSSGERTFIEEARRAQIIAAGVEVIAEFGSARASFTRIAKHAGLSSTGLISYHFAGRAELLEEISRTVLAAFAAHVSQRLEGETTARGTLATFLEANIEFMAGHRTQLLAYLDISRATPTGPHDAYLESDLAGLEELFREGQRDRRVPRLRSAGHGRDDPVHPRRRARPSGPAPRPRPGAVHARTGRPVRPRDQGGAGMRRRAVALAAVLTLTAACTDSPSAADPSASAVVRTDAGPVRGAVTDTYRLFQGVRYAAAPVGEDRWAAPKRPEEWRDVRDATKPGAKCPQVGSDVAQVTSDQEDCLFLNVTAPRTASKKAPKPVMVWIHGDGASGAGEFFDGRRLATTGDVVVITINYRLGAFGGFGLPGLADSGTFGLQDQQAALALGTAQRGRVRRRPGQGDALRRLLGRRVDDGPPHLPRRQGPVPPSHPVQRRGHDGHARRLDAARPGGLPLVRLAERRRGGGDGLVRGAPTRLRRSGHRAGLPAQAAGREDSGIAAGDEHVPALGVRQSSRCRRCRRRCSRTGSSTGCRCSPG